MVERKMVAWIKEPDKNGLTKIRCNIPKVTNDNVLVKVKATVSVEQTAFIMVYEG